MTDKEFKAIKTSVDKLFDKWQPILAPGWTLNVNYVRDPEEDLASDYGNCKCLWEYKEAWLNFNLKALLHKSEDYRESVVIHELSHLLVWPMREWRFAKGEDDALPRKIEEMVVTNLETVFMRLRRFNDAKKK